MTLDELIRNVQRIDVLSKSIPHKKLAGAFDSPYKGSGLAIDYIRKYEMGDDVRNINWNVSARFREPYVNTFTEDKERLIWIMVDVSSSSIFGTAGKSKLDLEIEIAATLAYSSLKKHDAVGAIFFSDKIEQLIQPAKGMANFWRIAKALVEIEPVSKSTNLCSALEFAMKVNNKKSLVFLISDFIANDNYAALCKTLAQKHDLTAIRIFDQRERELPNLGWVRVRDAETGTERWINSASDGYMNNFSNHFKKVEETFDAAFCNSCVNTLTVATDENYSAKLFQFMSSQ